MPAKICLIGKTFGRLKVIADAPIRKSPKGRPMRFSLCRCPCGNIVEVMNSCLTTGHTQSCRCLHHELARKRFTTHGHRPGTGATRAYDSWSHMIQRCTNPRDKSWKNYGGRGITVCARWFKFANFLKDMGDKPVGLTLERKDNEGNYCPRNCTWATWSEQMKNKRPGIRHGTSEQSK